MGVDVETLTAPFRAILEGKTEVAELTLDAINRRGKPFVCHVVCNPLMGTDNERQGIVIVMETVEK